MSLLYIIWNTSVPSLRKIPLLLLYSITSVLGMPFQLLEAIIYSRRLNKQTIHHRPVFIIGHWRSGTTYLHELLSKDPQFAFVNFYAALFPNTFLLFEKIAKPIITKLSKLLQWKIPYFNNINFDLDYPCEEDTAMMNMGLRTSAYWAYSFTKKADKLFSDTMFIEDPKSDKSIRFMKDYCKFLKKVSLRDPHKPLLLKSPPNTTRIRALIDAFPDAKFIYISRNVIDVFYSHKKLWHECMKRYSLQQINDDELDGIIIRTMNKVLHQYKADKVILDSSNLFEIGYQALLENPLQSLQNIYQQLEIAEFKNAEPYFKKHLEESKGYTPFQYNQDDAKIKWLQQHITSDHS